MPPKLKFQPRIRKAGELILAEDWNGIQNEISDDLKTIQEWAAAVEKRGAVMVASGIASHGLYIQLNWDVMPHVVLTPMGALKEQKPQSRLKYYPYEISPKGFMVHALSDDGTEGVVNWLAIGVV